MRTNLEQIPVVDGHSVLERLDGDRDLYNELIEIYFSDLPKQWNLLKDAFSAADYKVVERQAHSLKSASANIGAERVRAVAFDLEQISLDGDKENISELLTQLEEEIAVVKKELKHPC